jgi:hypothetical protein
MSRPSAVVERCHAAVADASDTGVMTSFLQQTLRSVRHDRDFQDAMFCTACWLSFASVVVASVALPA